MFSATLAEIAVVAGRRSHSPCRSYLGEYRCRATPVTERGPEARAGPSVGSSRCVSGRCCSVGASEGSSIGKGAAMSLPVVLRLEARLEFDEAFDGMNDNARAWAVTLSHVSSRRLTALLRLPSWVEKSSAMCAVRRCIAFRFQCITRWRRNESSSLRCSTANAIRKFGRLASNGVRHVAKFQTEAAHRPGFITWR